MKGGRERKEKGGRERKEKGGRGERKEKGGRGERKEKKGGWGERKEKKGGGESLSWLFHYDWVFFKSFSFLLHSSATHTPHRPIQPSDELQKGSSQ